MITRGGMRLVAVAVALALLVGHVPLALAAPTSRIDGRVFGKDLVTPAAALTVQAIPEGGKAPLASTLTDAKGHFDLQGLPAGSYVVLLRDAAGAPLAATRVATTAGDRQTLTLALPDRKPGETAAAPGQSRSGFFATATGGTVIAVAAAIVLAIAAHQLVKNDKSNEPVSPSRP